MNIRIILLIILVCAYGGVYYLHIDIIPRSISETQNNSFNPSISSSIGTNQNGCVNNCIPQCDTYANNQLDRIKSNPDAFITDSSGTKIKVTAEDYPALLQNSKDSCMAICKSDCGIKTPGVQIIG